MDKTKTATAKNLLDAALAAAGGLGVTVEYVHSTQSKGPAELRVTHGGREVQYTAEVRRALQTDTLGAAQQQLERLAPPALLVTDYVTPALADELKARHIQFLDTAGNAYLEQGPLLVWVKGQKRATKPATQTAGRAFQPTGLQVLFTLLCNPQAVNRPYRELAEMAGVAHGTVGYVVPDLQQLGYVRDLKGQRGTRRLFELERLLDEWATTYARVLRPRTLLGRYYVPTLEGWKDWAPAEHDALWGGEPAAALLTDYLRPGVLTIYADKLPGLLAARHRFMKEPGPGHVAVVEVRKRFWNFPVDPEHKTLVPTVLVYADLLATGDARCIETAKQIHDDHVARLFQEN
jgi:hypothetical protein